MPTNRRTVLNHLPLLLPPPTPYQRAGRNGRRTYTPTAQAAWTRAAILILRHHPGRPPTPHEGPVTLYVVAVHPRPKRLPPGPRMPIPSARMDLDNVVKLVADTITYAGGWWVDDSHVQAIVAGAWYAATGELACTEVAIQPEPAALPW